MSEVNYRNRRALRIENDFLRVTMTAEGANIAEIVHKASGVNPLWTPPWPSIEPSHWSDAAHAEYGASEESRVLASIMGHSICLDTYGSPSTEEKAAGIPIHGEGFTLAYETRGRAKQASVRSALPLAQLVFKRELALGGDEQVAVLRFREAVTNLCSFDRPIAWTQHVVLGAPFLEAGGTQVRAAVRESKVIDADFGGAQKRAADFLWPYCPKIEGGTIDLRKVGETTPSGGFTSHRVDSGGKHGYFVAWSPSTHIAFGYIWRRADFPWLCRWEENRLRTGAPWNGCTLALGMEFGVSPFVESRREMVDRGALFETPSFRWLPARGSIETSYCAFVGSTESVPEAVQWDGADIVRFVM